MSEGQEYLKCNNLCKKTVPVHPEPFESLTLKKIFNVATDLRTAIQYVCFAENHAHENINL